MHVESRWGVVSAVSFVAIASAFASAAGGVVPGNAGAFVTAAIASVALVLAMADQVSTVTAARAAAAMAIAATIGWTAADIPAVPAVDEGIGGVLWKGAAQRCFASALRGMVPLSLSALFLGITLAGRPVARSSPILLSLLLIGGWWMGEKLFSSLPDSVQSGLAAATFLSPPVEGKHSPLLAFWSGCIVLFGLLAWTRLVQGNRLAFRLGLWGAVAGGLAFAVAEGIVLVPQFAPLPASVLTFFAPLQSGPLRPAVTGLLWGGVLGWAVWRERRGFASTPDIGSLRAPWEFGLIAMHLVAVMASFISPAPLDGGLLDAYASSGTVSAAVPLACTLAGQRTPWVLLLPVALLPMIATSLQHAVFESHLLGMDTGWFVLAAGPVGVACAATAWAIMYAEDNAVGWAARPLGVALIVLVVTASGLAAAVLDFSWPWTKPTPHSSALVGLMALAVVPIIGGVRMVSARHSRSVAVQPPSSLRA